MHSIRACSRIPGTLQIWDSASAFCLKFDLSRMFLSKHLKALTSEILYCVKPNFHGVSSITICDICSPGPNIWSVDLLQTRMLPRIRSLSSNPKRQLYCSHIPAHVVESWVKGFKSWGVSCTKFRDSVGSWSKQPSNLVCSLAKLDSMLNSVERRNISYDIWLVLRLNPCWKGF